MPFAAALSTLPDTAQAITEVCDFALGQLGGVAPELAIVFFSPHHVGEETDLAALFAQRLGDACIIGCMGESIVGTGREIENAPAISLWLGNWGGKLRIDGFHLQLMRTPDGPSFLGWPDALFDVEPDSAALLVLGDPFSFPIGEQFLPRVNDDYPGMPLLGGMASGSSGPGENVLLFANELRSEGAVGVLLRGPRCWRQIVSQGCRPIGSPLIVTRSEENIVFELNGTTPLTLLQRLYPTLDANDQALLERGLHLGIAVKPMESTARATPNPEADVESEAAPFPQSESASESEADVTSPAAESPDLPDEGDSTSAKPLPYVIRNVYGFDRSSGAMVVTDRVEVGQVVQFHLRDQASASADLQTLLQADRASHPQAAAALLFTCNGRGSRMFTQTSHDAGKIAQAYGNIPLAGLFAAGELGPIGSTNFIHGFTASVLVFDA
ncbi:FIST signal transduction protein [Tuwongella immobilis]|uniref:FIST C-domain domain-containing protein n=1 Tax=Tuwongella immobilis TaxID=692036 RepID=A0A6C2YU47_9BACT|nr:FIST N-terminal domain-containing protein [Tuwongella immobilis]VIP05016.1 Uncharacterized protein OS=Pirellula staleyi (strain ATCC 27377 / DSM 6068 / ICPB 4128) GN=Psta_0358 PE=4 SV=1: FIST: FIST_C [Tuwongella immobilis]VTS07390.1 Uncharacterized protein OS=Pirellula staleyi (strain ATCC 27377 / DSM 6068 / ICPB 4128) GN=Psta_0358 PE=4 SV=1: FIST: FIST_C [Tuwongella immobilis]